MELYQSVTAHVTALLDEYPKRRETTYDGSRCWQETERFELVMGRESAYELGGSGNGSANCTIVTSDSERFAQSKVIVIGNDLPEIKQDSPYARLVILSLDPEKIPDPGNKAGSEAVFRLLQKLDFIKYHVFAKGYMIRTSTENYREQVRVQKQALKDGITFEKVGNTFIKHYLEADGVLAATVIFLTDPSVDYEALRNDAAKVHDITMTFSKILEGMPTDCSMCSLKPICDEVEGMREMHFGKGESPK
ncbi:MAG: hypothetical protein IKS37_01090 [Solobacterium sp.]|nr:hypothetical protein [Solobacterium sp.]